MSHTLFLFGPPQLPVVGRPAAELEPKPRQQQLRAVRGGGGGGRVRPFGRVRGGVRRGGEQNVRAAAARRVPGGGVRGSGRLRDPLPG